MHAEIAHRVRCARLQDQPRWGACCVLPRSRLKGISKNSLSNTRKAIDSRDDGIEYPVRDRLSLLRFWGLQLEDRVSDAKAVWLFRKRLKRWQLVADWFQRFQAPLAAHGDMARAGQMVAARLVEAPRPRSSREENTLIKSGTPPADWPGKKRRQKDVAAR